METHGTCWSQYISAGLHVSLVKKTDTLSLSSLKQAQKADCVNCELQLRLVALLAAAATVRLLFHSAVLLLLSYSSSS